MYVLEILENFLAKYDSTMDDVFYMRTLSLNKFIYF
jgi:hypothetical protein